MIVYALMYRFIRSSNFLKPILLCYLDVILRKKYALTTPNASPIETHV